MSQASKPHRFSDLYRITHMTSDHGSEVMFLCVKKDSNKEYVTRRLMSQNTRGKNIRQEIAMLTELHHKNIVKLVELCKEGAKYHYLVLDITWSGELFRELVRRDKYTEADVSHLIREILSGVEYLHSNGIVHRNLKPNNLLLTNTKADLTVKICDLGLSTRTTQNFVYCGHTKCYYMAPEMLKRLGCGSPLDVWECGVILYIMLVGKPPYSKAGRYLLKHMNRGVKSFPNDGGDEEISYEGKEFIKALLNPDPALRITATQALQHDFIRKLSNTNLQSHRINTIVALKKSKRKIEKWNNVLGGGMFVKLRNQNEGDTANAARTDWNSNEDAAADLSTLPVDKSRICTQDVLLPAASEMIVTSLYNSTQSTSRGNNTEKTNSTIPLACQALVAKVKNTEDKAMNKSTQTPSNGSIFSRKETVDKTTMTVPLNSPVCADAKEMIDKDTMTLSDSSSGNSLTDDPKGDIITSNRPTHPPIGVAGLNEIRGKPVPQETDEGEIHLNKSSLVLWV